MRIDPFSLNINLSEGTWQQKVVLTCSQQTVAAAMDRQAVSSANQQQAVAQAERESERTHQLKESTLRQG